MFKEELTILVTEYFNSIPELEGQVPSAILIGFAVEKYKQKRNFPKTFTATQIESDLKAHTHTIAMAIVDLAMKSGAEGETRHDENGTNRLYENAYISESLYADVLPYVTTIS